MVIRLFITSIAQADLDRVLDLIRSDVIPAFEAHPDCVAIDILMSDQTGAGGLVEGGVMTRWSSEEAMERGLSDPTIRKSQERVLPLLRREPVRRTFRVMN